MQEYALERLVVVGELDAAGRNHARYYLALAEQAEPELTGRKQRIWFERLEWAHENLRTALRWLFDHDEGELALRLATALGYFWEAREILEAVWAAAPQGGRERILLRACILIANGNLRLRMEKPGSAGRLFNEALGELRYAALAEFGTVQTTVDRVDDGQLHLAQVETQAPPAAGTDSALLAAGHPTLTALESVRETSGPVIPQWLASALHRIG